MINDKAKKSNVKFKRQLKRKTNSASIEVIKKAGKLKEWRRAAEILVGGTKKYSALNLSEIDKKSEAGDTIVVLGKVLSKGELTKKLRICALSFSKNAEEKILKSKSEAVLLIHEINKNQKAEGIKILQ